MASGGDKDKHTDWQSAEEEEIGDMEKLKQFFSQMLNLRGTSEEKEELPKILDEPSFEAVARYIYGGRCKNIITMVGAGISTSAGIPDFRSPGSGLYDNLQQYDLPHPTAIFEIGFFKENPKPFFVLAKELYPGSFRPTPCHYFIRMLHDKGLLLRHYTQNIDTLERVAGIPDEKLVEAHGSFHTSHCMECNAKYSLPWMKEKIFADEVPKCTQEGCGGIVKPDIVFFGESLPARFAVCAQQDFKKCDLLLIMGTSLAVQPFASLAARVSPSTPRVYINLDRGQIGDDPMLALLIGGRACDFTFDEEDNVRDVYKQATCDDGCLELADLLGWGEELRKLIQTEHQRIDKEKGNIAEGSSVDKPAQAASGSSGVQGQKVKKDVSSNAGSSSAAGDAENLAAKAETKKASQKL